MENKNNLIAQIKNLLDELSSSTDDNESVAFSTNFEILEIPSIISDIVDYLQPHLHPYEAAIYWHLFRNSVLLQGSQYCRVSVRGMCQGVIKSSSGQGSKLSYASVQDALKGLKDKGIISEDGETNREGTLYKVNLPDEIEICKSHKLESLKIEPVKIIESDDLDFYNVKANRQKIFERDNYTCFYCKKLLTRFTATLDHIQPVSKGGDNSFNNLITACLHCNSRRGNAPVSDAIVNNR